MTNEDVIVVLKDDLVENAEDHIKDLKYLKPQSARYREHDHLSKDPLSAIRGILVGILISIPIWVLIFVLIFR